MAASIPSIGQTPASDYGYPGRSAVYFVPPTARSALFSLNSPAHTPDPDAVSTSYGGKMPDLRLRRNPPGTPRLWPRLAVILRLDKTAV
jgi:hypothetical protein